jgi:hypothetical protein
LLSTISEKDAIIGSLEYDRGNEKSNQQRIFKLNEEKDYLHQQLKDLVSNLRLNIFLIIILEKLTFLSIKE